MDIRDDDYGGITKKHKYKELRFLLNKASEMLDNLYTAHLKDEAKEARANAKDRMEKGE